MDKRGVEVIIENLQNHPHCSHGPTLLFCRDVKGEKQNFFACAACRDRKHCPFFLWKKDESKYKTDNSRVKYLKDINHRKKFMVFNKVTSLASHKRVYCHTCMKFELTSNEKHLNHNVLKGMSDYELSHPTEILPPLENAKVEAQYLFAKSSTATIVHILRSLGYRNIICMGAPRIHEYIQASFSDNMSSILLDIDKRFHSFFGPLQYCCYNLFNHYFFLDESRSVFNDFLKSNRGQGMVLVTDPPFGGRIEPLVSTFNTINSEYKKLNNISSELPIFLIFPYFMEPHILNWLSNFKMLDYKVEYDNHPLFQNGRKGRKQGSPVRMFTNINPSLINLPVDDYKYCKICARWVAIENKHCSACNSCTSKDGRTYIHCYTCEKCVKPTWFHCKICNRCAQEKHECGLKDFTKNCFNCKKTGHKKQDCPSIGDILNDVKVDSSRQSKKRLKGKEIKRKPAKKSKIK